MFLKVVKDMNLKDNTLLIVPSGIKEDVIENVRENNPLLDITFITKDEFIKKVTFDYNNQAIYYLMNKYKMKYEIAKVYLDNIYYVDLVEYESNKLKKLTDLKKELLLNDLLITSSDYVSYIKTKNIVVYGFNNIDKYFAKVLKQFDNVQFINKKYNNYPINYIYELDNMDDEVEYVAIKICQLITDNIDINNIKICFDSSYNNTVKRIFNLYNLPINLDKISLYNTYVGNYFIENLNSDKNISLENIKEFDLDVYNRIVDILNKYTWCEDLLLVKDMLNYELKNSYIEKKLVNNIEIIDLKDNNVTDNDYVFVLGFNQGSIPVIYKDENYITDNIASVLDLETTLEKNINEKKVILNNLKNFKNLTLTYKLNSDTTKMYISNLYDELTVEIKKGNVNDYTYSNKVNKIKLTKYLDKLTNYGIKNDDLGILYNNYDVDYKTFDNKYTKINKDNLYKFLDNKLLLSYTSLDNYNKCSFKYYLANILKISIYEDTFMSNIGTIFHEVLSKINNEDFNLDIEYNNSIKNLDKDFTVKEQFFLEKLKSELKFIVDTIRKQTSYSSLDNYLYEEKIYTNITGNIKVTFMGVIDKLVYKKCNDKTIVAIIDYKTGNPNTNLNNVIYGLDMQLPIYLYLAKNTNKLSKVEVAGFYLQKVLNNEIVKDYKNSYNKLKEDNLKLVGYSNSDVNILSEFDKTYNDSLMVKSLKTTKEGFYTYSKVISSENIDKITNIIENKIKENTSSILDCEFDINPKRQKYNEILGCKYCSFSDICFRKEEDIVDIKEYKNLEFLESEENI